MAERSDITADHEWHTNTDHVLEFTIYQADGTTAQNITGWALSWLLKRNHDASDADALLTKTTASALQVDITSGATGRVDVIVLDTDTLSLAGGTYVHELKRTDAGEESVLSYGRARLKQSLHLT